MSSQHITPASLGFRMPAEWEPHEATWIAWPHQREDWPGKFEPIPWVYAEIVRHLHMPEEVRILVNGPDSEAEIRDILTKAHVDLGRVAFFQIETDRVWTRDYGPIFVKSRGGQVAMTKWRFNAWAKYDNWHKDDAVVAQLQNRLGLDLFEARLGDRRIVLEGGSIDVNGQGVLMTTEECLLSPVQERNPGVSRSEIERTFADYLGIDRVLWLNRGIVGDDTHGHIDDLARFVNPRTIVTVVEENKQDDNFEPLQENLAWLRSFGDFEIVTLPMPDPLWFNGQRIPASYANFYIANSTVLVPTFNDVHDRIALETLAKLFPTRRVVGIHAVDLVWGFGTLHCLTQQQPV